MDGGEARQALHYGGRSGLLRVVFEQGAGAVAVDDEGVGGDCVAILRGGQVKDEAIIGARTALLLRYARAQGKVGRQRAHMCAVGADEIWIITVRHTQHISIARDPGRQGVTRVLLPAALIVLERLVEGLRGAGRRGGCAGGRAGRHGNSRRCG